MKSGIVALALMFVTSSASAEIVQDHYKNVAKRIPHSVEVCKDVIESGDKTGDTLMGAIIGGVVGHQIDHKDGSKIGAVVGGMIGHNNSDAKGRSRSSCVIETRYDTQYVEVYSHSTVTFSHDGRKYTLRFTR